MKTLIVYNGRFGNTERAAESIKEAIASHSDKVTIRNVRNEKKFSELLKQVFPQAPALDFDDHAPKYPEVSLDELGQYDFLISGGPNSPAPFRADFTEFNKKVGGLDLSSKKTAVFDTRYAEDQNPGPSGETVEALQRAGATVLGETLHLFIPFQQIPGPLVEGELDKVGDWVEELLKELEVA